MNNLANSPELDGYSQKVRVNYHEVNPQNNSNKKSNTFSPSTVKFVSQHKKHPGLKAIISLSIGAVEAPSLPEAENTGNIHYFNHDKSSILKIESLQVFDSHGKISDLSNDVLEELLSSILLATYEYGNSHSIREWLVPVNPGFDEDLSEMGLVHNRYSFDERGRCIIGVRPGDFLSKGKQLIQSWTRRLFECEPLLN